MLAGLAALYFLLLGGRFDTFLIDPDVALLSLLLLAGLALAGYAALLRRLPGDALALILLLTLLWAGVATVTAMDRRMAAEALWWQLVFVGLVFLGRRVGAAAVPGLLVGAAGVAVLGLAQLAGLIPAAGGYLTEGGGVRISASLHHPNNLCGFIALMLPVVLSALVARAGKRVFVSDDGSGSGPLSPRERVGVRATRSQTSRPETLTPSLSLGERGPDQGEETGERTRHRRVRTGMDAVPAALLTIALLVCAAGTYSRAGQAAVAAGLLAWLVALPAQGLRGWWRGNPRRAALLLAAGLVCLAVLGAAIVASGAGERIRLFLELLPTWRKYQRVDTWLTALRMVRLHPLVGVGPGCFFLAYPLTKTATSYPDLFGHAHSWYLQVAAEGGVPALMGLLAVLGLALRAALRGAREAADEGARLRQVGLFGGIVGFMAAGLADHNVGVPAIGMGFWFLLGVAAGGSAEGAEADGVGVGRHRAARYGAALAACCLYITLVPMALWNRAHSAYQAFLADVAADRLDVAVADLQRAQHRDPYLRVYRLAEADLARARGASGQAVQVLSDLEPRGWLDSDTWYLAQLGWLRRSSIGEEGNHLLKAHWVNPAEPVFGVDEGFSELMDRRAELPHLLAEPARDLLHGTAALAGLGLWDLHVGRPAAAAGRFDRAALVNDPRDRAARFLVGYGRVDPLVVIPPERRGFLFTDRVRYHGPILSRLRCRMLQAEALARTVR